MTLLLAIALAGALAGLLGGLLGIGGGLVIVPALVWIFAAMGFAPATLMQFAIATSLASILFTGASSVLAHHRRGAVRWDLVRLLAPTLALGAALGSFVADWIGSDGLMRLFGIFAALLGLRMLLARGIPADVAAAERPLSRGVHLLAGAVIGVASALFGIGGGSLTVPYLHGLRVRMQQAVATSSACGMPIAAAGAAGFMLAGWSQPALPAGALGYVYLPGLLALALASVPMAAVGARLAHRLPAATLRRLFALVLLVVAADFLLQ